MLAAMVFMSLCGIFIIAKDYKNRFSWIIGTYLFSMILLLLSIALYTNKLSYYPLSFGVENRLYFWLSEINLHINEISRLNNIGFAMLIATSWLFFAMELKNWMAMVFGSICTVFFLVTTDPSVSLTFYLKIYESQGAQFGKMYDYIMMIDLLILLASMCAPFISLWVCYRKTRVYVKKRQAIISAILFGIIYVFIIGIFFFSPFKYLNFYHIGLLKLPEAISRWNVFFVSATIMVMVLLLILGIILLFRPFSKIYMVTDKELKKQSKQIEKNLRMILHTQKNVMFLIKTISEQSLQELLLPVNEEGWKEVLTYNGKIQEVAGEALENISRNLNMMRNICVQNDVLYVNGCLDEAIENTCEYISEVTIERNYSDDIYIFADYSYIKELFVNVLNNALDAMKTGKTVKPKIIVNLDREDDFAIIEITDNGCGIPPKKLRKIFEESYSTKQNASNWGFGLTYVKKIADTYKYHVGVRSKLGEYTTFQFDIPINLKEGEEADE